MVEDKQTSVDARTSTIISIHWGKGRVNWPQANFHPYLYGQMTPLAGLLRDTVKRGRDEVTSQKPCAASSNRTSILTFWLSPAGNAVPAHPARVCIINWRKWVAARHV